LPEVRGGRRAEAGEAYPPQERRAAVRTEPLTVVVVSGGRDALPVIAAARRLGLRVLVSDGAPDAPGFRLADAGLVAGVCDAEATVAAVRAYATSNRVDGVIGVGADAAPTVAAVAAALRLPGWMPAPPGDRLETAARLRRRGVPVPWSAPVADPSALADLAASGSLVVRPVHAGHARAAVRLSADVDPEWAFAMVEVAAGGGRLMVEAAADASRVHALALVAGGRVAAAFFADRRDESGVPFVVRGLDFPSRRAGYGCEALLAQAVAVLEMRSGLFEADIVLVPDGPRMAGIVGCLTHAPFATHQLPLATGLPIVESMLGLTLGRSPAVGEPRREPVRATALRYVYAPAGTVVHVSGVEDATAGGALCELHVAPGHLTAAFAPAPVGFVLAGGDTLDEAIARAEDGAAHLRVLATPPGQGDPSHATLH
jgi:hypothetical protein